MLRSATAERVASTAQPATSRRNLDGGSPSPAGRPSFGLLPASADAATEPIASADRWSTGLKVLPPELEADAPPEARGLRRDQVRLMVSQPDGRIEHSRFDRIGHFLQAGDLLVINVSSTRKASLDVVPDDAAEPRLRLHVSTALGKGRWIAELRRPAGVGSRPYLAASTDAGYRLPGGGRARLIAPYARSRGQERERRGQRLWLARLELPMAAEAYFERFGHPIRYAHASAAWPIEAYRTVYAQRMGSAEMPSAGRAFSPELITDLVAAGVDIVPLVLHAGVSSLEAGESPYPEWFEIEDSVAARIRAAKRAGRRIIAIGTTVVRALESALDSDGQLVARRGWTDRVIAAEDRLQVVDGLLTGLHEPQASHLAMLEAVAGPQSIDLAYREAVAEGYLWHEFGDLHLIL